ncbi:MAG: MerR family transcriptional regulator [Deltaproteobacteria bacterium]|nr:MerR family transcriptional regulator [Deltaproteobacteria bacterium]
MNLTLSIDEKVADEARRAAQSMGMSLNQAVRLYLERLAGREQLEAELAAFKASALRSTGRRKGWTFDRNELHERS